MANQFPFQVHFFVKKIARLTILVGIISRFTPTCPIPTTRCLSRLMRQRKRSTWTRLWVSTTTTREPETMWRSPSLKTPQAAQHKVKDNSEPLLKSFTCLAQEDRLTGINEREMFGVWFISRSSWDYPLKI